MRRADAVILLLLSSTSILAVQSIGGRGKVVGIQPAPGSEMVVELGSGSASVGDRVRFFRPEASGGEASATGEVVEAVDETLIVCVASGQPSFDWDAVIEPANRTDGRPERRAVAARPTPAPPGSSDGCLDALPGTPKNPEDLGPGRSADADAVPPYPSASDSGRITQRAEAIRIGDGVVPPMQTKAVPPEYPELARLARVQGAVVLDAEIDPTGKVTEARILRSVPLLDEAAITAVKQWEYTPTRVNGVPVAVIMTVTVTFALE